EHGTYILKKPNVSPDTFDTILKYIYTGTIAFDNVGDHALNILLASDEFELHNLTECTQDHIIKYHSSWIASNLLILIRVDFAAFRECVSRCIPSIRFCQMSSNEYYIKVRKVFKKVIPEEIDEQVLQYHLNPGFHYEYINVDPLRNSNRKVRKALCEVPYNNESRNTLDSFIFSLTNRANPVLSRIAKDQAIFWDGMKGPCFGETDLCMKASSESADAPITVSTTYSSMSSSASIRQQSQINWFSRQKNYQRKITDTEAFDVEEFEVFLVDNYYLQFIRIVNSIIRKSWELTRLGYERGYEIYSEIPNDKLKIIFDACVVASLIATNIEHFYLHSFKYFVIYY
ncbi:4556_t:CDS:2, partial [Gigaspora margarita]